MSSSVLAQPAPPPPAPGDAPANPAAPAPAPEPAPPPNPPAPSGPPTTPAPEPPKTVFPAMAGNSLRFSDMFQLRPGMLLQMWSSATQDPIPHANGDAGDFAKNFYLRRARFYMLGGIGTNINFFLLWESGNLGLSTLNADGSVNKNFTTFAFNDAYLDFKANPHVSVQAGLMLIPFTRNILQSTGTYWTLDIGGVSASYIAATATNVLRDTGLQLKINALENHFELRGMVSQGIKQPDAEPAGRAPGKNDPRFTAYAQYNVFDPDVGYVFNGQYFGRKKIAGVAVGADYQSIDGENPYFATSATAFAAIPVHGADPKNGDDEFGGQVEYLHFHGGGAPPASALGKRDGVLAELGYYNKGAKLSVFGKFEGTFLDGVAEVGNTRIFAGGLKYFFAEAIANVTLYYARTQFPKAPDTGPTARNDTNQITLQLQLGYF
ncbi:MAG TPA: porin [Kofleriaceae bacterium]|nr:porin [Kofleriaceae bacterium]